MAPCPRSKSRTPCDVCGFSAARTQATHAAAAAAAAAAADDDDDDDGDDGDDDDDVKLNVLRCGLTY